MTLDKNSTANTFLVAVTLCLVCSAAVAGAAYSLKSQQNANQDRYRKQNVLAAAGLYNEDLKGEKIDEMYDQWVIPKIIRLPGDGNKPAGQDVSSEYEVDGGLVYDQKKASEDQSKRIDIDTKNDIAKLKNREKHSFVYMIKSSPNDDTPDKYVFPVRGKGLWSMMWGFVSVNSDMDHITGLSYYDQGETPGLGGEVENPKWKAQWEQGIRIYDREGNIVVNVAKGQATSDNEVDGLSGATITSNGVSAMLEYWLGEDGFGPYMQRIREKKSEKVAVDEVIKSLKKRVDPTSAGELVLKP